MAYRLQENFYVDGNDHDILQRMQESWNQNSQANQSYWLEGSKDVRFKIGDQSIWNEFYADYPIFQRKKYNFNRIRRIINMVAGYQRKNRKTSSVLPMEGSDEITAEQFTKLIDWVNQTNNAYHTISEAFENACTTGMSMLSIWNDYRFDPINGDIRINNLAYNSYMLDQFFRNPDMSDCNFLWTRKYISNQQAADLMPSRKKEIMEMQGSRRDEKFIFQPETFNLRNNKLLSYDEYWYLSTRKVTILVDDNSGETMEWSGDKENLSLFLKRFPQIRAQKIDKPTVKLATVLQNKVMYDGENPYGIDKYPFVPVICYFEPDSPYYEWKIQGLVRQLRDAQFLYNRRKLIELDILESQINSGMKVMEGSLVDDNDAFLSGQGRGLFIKSDAPMGMDSVQQIMPPQVPPSMIQLSEILGQEINQISGVNEELLGSAEDDKAGILSMLRQGAGLTTLQFLFDNLDRSQKLLGQLTMEMIQAKFSPGKIKRVLNQEPSQEFYNKAFGKYDCVVTDGMLTETQRKASFITMLELVKLGILDPNNPMILEKAPIPEKQDLIKSQMEIQKRSAEASQQAQQLQLAQVQSQINLANARAHADQGLGYERMSRIEENKELAVERRAKAVEDISDARLNRIKGLKELDGLTISHLQELIKLKQLAEGSQMKEEQNINKEL